MNNLNCLTYFKIYKVWMYQCTTYSDFRRANTQHFSRGALKRLRMTTAFEAGLRLLSPFLQQKKSPPRSWLSCNPYPCWITIPAGIFRCFFLKKEEEEGERNNIMLYIYIYIIKFENILRISKFQVFPHQYWILIYFHINKS